MKRNGTSPARDLATKLVTALLVLGTNKSTLGSLAREVVRSIGTARSFIQCVTEFLVWRTAGGVGLDEPVTAVELEGYLTHESLRWRQKTLDQHRQALSLVFCVALMHVDAEVPTYASGRAYTCQEMELVAAHQQEHNALGTRLAFHSGLRAIELPELRPTGALPPADRPWHKNLFLGLEGGMFYGTTGKGGLPRRVWVPEKLHAQLQARSRSEALIVHDREIVRSTVFDVGGGHALSQSFSSASRRALGFSLGLHGLRHTYVQHRIEKLLGVGVAPLDALEIVSQEVGHLRADITTAYLTRRA